MALGNSEKTFAYRQSRGKAALLGIGGLYMIALGFGSIDYTRAWPILLPIFLILGCRAVYLAQKRWRSTQTLIISSRGIVLRDSGRSREAAWHEVSAINVSKDDGASHLEIWTGGDEPFLSTLGWTAAPRDIAAQMRALKRDAAAADIS